MIATMWKSVARWTAGLLALFVIGPLLASVLTGSLRGPTGGHDASLILSSSPLSGVLVGLAVMALAMVVGVLAGRLVGLKSGMLVAGFVTAWGAWRLGTIDEILRVAVNQNARVSGGGLPSGGGSALITLAFEGFASVIAALLVTAVVDAAARARQPVAPSTPRPATAGRAPKEPQGLAECIIHVVRETFAGMPALVGIAAGAAAGAAAVWIVAFEPLKGQAVLAAAIGAIAAGATSQLAAQSMGGRATLLTPVASMAIVALLGPIATDIVQGGRLVQALYSQNILALAVPVSLDWAAGALLGAPIGLSWVGVMLEKHEPKPA